MSEIVKLNENVINQIAAGEVVDRPAAIIKELIENAIDANSSQIEIFLEEGGVKRIEIRDNGKGILVEDLVSVFQRYATSKIQDIKDLEKLISYGFRGEALAAISAVSNVKIISKREGYEAHSITCNYGEISSVVPASRGNGTTIIVENLFEKVPARLKFLKKSETEYRYALEIFNYFALINGNIHIKLFHNNKEVFNLPKSEGKLFPIERIAKLFKIDEKDLLSLDYEEYGVKCKGVILHPRILGPKSRISMQYINNRPIIDKGIFVGMQQGVRSYVPENYKASGVIGVFMEPDQFDINVHPRKMEVKFLNPFRVYNAVTNAVKTALQQKISADNSLSEPSYNNSNYSQSYQTPLAPSSNTKFNYSSKWEKKDDNAYNRLRSRQESMFEEPKNSSTVFVPDNDIKEIEYSVSLENATVFQIMNRYIIVVFSEKLWVIDQHAAAERIRFEQLKKAYLDGKLPETQTLLVPLTIHLSEVEKTLVNQAYSTLKRLGFEGELLNNEVLIKAVPVVLQKGDIESIFRNVLVTVSEHLSMIDVPIISDYSTEKDLSSLIATMACHSSIRMNQKVSSIEAKGMVADLLKCDIPYSCPHGRRIIWKLTTEEIDKQFMRT